MYTSEQKNPWSFMVPLKGLRNLKFATIKHKMQYPTSPLDEKLVINNNLSE